MNSNSAPIELPPGSKSGSDANHEGHAANEKFRADIKNSPVDASTSRGPKPASLPDVEIFDSKLKNDTVGAAKDVVNAEEKNWSNLKAGVNAAEKIAPQMMKGAVQEVEQHPLQIASDAMFGAVAGIAVGAMGMMAPEAVIGFGLAAASYETYKVMMKAGDWANDARIDTNPTQFSQKDIAAVNTDLQATGASAAQALAAGIGGAGSFAYIGLGDSALTGALRSATGEYGQPVDNAMAGVAGYMTSAMQHLTNELEKKH